MNTTDNQSIFPLGDKAPAEYFVGTAYVNMLVPQNPAFNTTVADVVFEPGCRNNRSAVRWHSHPGGQLLLCTDGEGYYQERGQPIQLLRQGGVVQIQPGVIHWHGATPDSPFTHIAIGPNAQLGSGDWLGPVTDEDYTRYQKS